MISITKRSFSQILITSCLFIVVVSVSFAASVNYQYDDLNRLQQVEYADGFCIIYGYDEVGNRISHIQYNKNAGDLPYGSMLINDGADHTSSALVKLTLLCAASSSNIEMEFSNDHVEWSAPEPYATIKNWVLSEGDGDKTVYVQFNDLDSDRSNVVSQTISLTYVAIDTDNDGLSDDWEILYGLNPQLDDSGDDLDTDGLTNLQEFQAGTLPNDEDSDDDEMPDGWEVDHQLNPLSGSDATEDGDTDGLTNLMEYVLGTNPEKIDTDDDDVNDGIDVFPLDPNEWANNDGDALGDNADPDDDNDGVIDTEDAYPFDDTESANNDGDEFGDNADTDDDNDGVLDTEDDFPLDPTETVDTDNDGIGDNTDDHVDGIELIITSQTNLQTSVAPYGKVNTTSIVENIGDQVAIRDITVKYYQSDDSIFDSSDTYLGNKEIEVDLLPGATLQFTKGVDLSNVIPGTYYIIGLVQYPIDEANPDNNTFSSVAFTVSLDTDGDGFLDTEDDFPVDPTLTGDFDGDGADNLIDPDDDGDGVIDLEDRYPLDASETVDTDRDGTGNNADIDDDNDGILDAADSNPLVADNVAGVELLTISQTSPTLSVVPGATVTTVATVKNIGNEEADRDITVYYFLSADAFLETSDTYLGSNERDTDLPAGDTLQFTKSVTLPNLEPGDYYLIGLASYSGDEVHDENNAFSSESFNVSLDTEVDTDGDGIPDVDDPNPLVFDAPEGIDLIVTAQSGPTGSVLAGSSITVTDTIKNQGLETATYWIFVSHYLSTDTVLDVNDIEINPPYSSSVYPSRFYSPTDLAHGGTLDLTRTVNLPTVSEGVYYLISRVDYSFYTSNEANSSNNTFVGAAFTVQD